MNDLDDLTLLYYRNNAYRTWVSRIDDDPQVARRNHDIVKLYEAEMHRRGTYVRPRAADAKIGGPGSSP